MDNNKDQKLKAGEKLVLHLDKLVDIIKTNIKEGKEWSATSSAGSFCHYLTDYSLASEFKTLEGDWAPFSDVKWKSGWMSTNDEERVRDELAIAFDEPHENGNRSIYRFEIYNHWQVDGEFGFDDEDPDGTSVVAIGKQPNVGPWRDCWHGLPRDREAFAKLLFNILTRVSLAGDRLNHDHLKQAIQEAMDKYDPKDDDE